ncbi:DUF4861 domain-containing protein [uncultured Bacteroides sp.]|uniref:DUF4861 domain-containing protein n=1 Tax=uncultured Bacteroides sp. TaxID=162156 RepID=UPI00260431DB|nr:DUF4861 domain-containing protein [uncultured Bacteroides sp.]
MKKLFLLVATVLCCFACTNTKDAVTVTVSNPLAMERSDEMVEVAMSDIADQLKLADTAQIVVLNADGQQVPYQITYDEKVIFPASVAANGTATYTIQVGTPEAFAAKACGRYYPERVDDVAWENDLVAFRTYGPALQKTGERAFGYDVWTKYNTIEPVVEARYANELNPDTKAKIAELKKTDPEAAKELYRSVSYHVDHGNGLDCYKVGPTLGGGTAALMPDGEIVYPYCYATQDILDNGPLRFTVKLTYNPLTIKGDSTVIETRVISLDAGSHLNKTVVAYDNLKEVTPVVTGIVLHEPDGAVVADAANGYITYVDPTDNVNNNNGKIFVGAAFPATVKEAKSLLFSEQEKNELRGGADGHVLAISDYEPGAEYVYYWGAAWDKADIKSAEAWSAYMANFAQKVRNPLTVTVK